MGINSLMVKLSASHITLFLPVECNEIENNKLKTVEYKKSCCAFAGW